jgi:hypothetical protein
MSSAQLATFLNRQSTVLKLWFEPADRQGYDAFEVWRSVTTEGGPYVALTGPAWGPALFVVRCRSAKLNGKALDLVAGATELTISFEGVDPFLPSAAAAAINSQALGLVRAQGFDATGYLQISSVDVGCKARLEIVGGEAALVLGLPLVTPLNTTFGVDATPRLSNKNAYEFEDAWGQSGHFYKTRLCNIDGHVSEFSNPIAGHPTRAVPMDRLVRGSVRIVDIQGRPCRNRDVMIARRDGVHVSYAGGLLVDTQDTLITTDETGYASVLLMRGIPVTVSVAGTALVRDITPPQDSDIDTFNLFEPAIGTDDAFVVQTISLNLAERGAQP